MCPFSFLAADTEDHVDLVMLQGQMQRDQAELENKVAQLTAQLKQEKEKMQQMKEEQRRRASQRDHDN